MLDNKNDGLLYQEAAEFACGAESKLAEKRRGRDPREHQPGMTE